MLPFSQEALFSLFESYNLAIWPAQVVAYALGLLALALVFRPTPWSGRVIGAVVALFWVWTGVVFHWLYFAPLNFSAPLFAALFVTGGLMFAWRIAVRGVVMFRFQGDIADWAGLVLMLFALAGYPLLGAASGHLWPQAVTFGVASAPTVIFTLGMLLLAEPRVPTSLAVAPLLWTLIGGATAWVLGIPEDASLPVAGLAALVLMIGKNRRARQG